MLSGFRLNLLFFLMVLLIVSGTIRAVEKGDDDSSPSKTIIGLTYNCDFDEAMRVVDSVSAREPDSIKWRFFRSFVLWQRLIFLDSAGAEDKMVETRFMGSVNEVITYGEKRISRNPSDTNALFYTGFALGYLAKYDAAEGDKIKAAREADKGLSYHKKLVSICPEWYDVYFSEALFNYYTCVLPWYMKPILFILGRTGSRNRAYELLSLVSTKGTIAKYEAENILGELYEREGRYDSSCFEYSKLITCFPNSTPYYFDRIIWAFTTGNLYQMVVRKCKEALEFSKERQMTHWDSLYVGKIYSRLADAYEKLGDHGEAMETYNELANYSNTPYRVSEAHFSMARLYEQANDSPDAIREYEWVVNGAAAPELSKEARERLDDLGVR